MVSDFPLGSSNRRLVLLPFPPGLFLLLRYLQLPLVCRLCRILEATGD